ncbi:MAG: hypothetical protein JXR70_16580 [Spirochaetales bacterium]|nr:hypothetical protein [Spirochaetales bacterium]
MVFTGKSGGTSPLDLTIDNLTNSDASSVEATAVDGSITVDGPIITTGSATLYIAPQSQTIDAGDSVNVSIMADVEGGNLAAYGIVVAYNASILSVTGDDVTAGSDGFMAAANASNGRLTISGFDVNGIGPANGLELVTINFTGNDVGGTSQLTLTVDNITNSAALAIESSVRNGSISVNPGVTDPPVTPPPTSGCKVATSDISFDGAGEGCYEFYCFGSDSEPWNSYINSWNMDSLTINGVNVTNTYKSYSDISKPADGVYVVKYKSSYAWSHFEVKGVCAGQSNPTPTPIESETPTPTPTTTPVENTPTPTITTEIETVDVYIAPRTQTVMRGDAVKVTINADIPQGNVAAYGFIVQYNASVLSISSNGMAAGIDGFFAAGSVNGGKVTISGFDVNGVGPGNNLELVSINCNAIGVGTSTLSLTVDNLTNSSAEAVNSNVTNGSVTVIDSNVDPVVVYIEPSTLSLPLGSEASVAVAADIPQGDIAAYGFIVSFNASILSTAANKVKAGSDGFLAAAALNGSRLTISGFDVNGVGPGNGLEIVEIGFTAITSGTSELTLTVDNLTGSDAQPVVNTVKNGSITVAGTDPTPTPYVEEPTPTIISDESAKVYLDPAMQTIQHPGTASVNITVDVTGTNVAAYGVALSFDSSVVSTTSADIKKGDDGFLAAAAIKGGTITISGFDVNGIGPGNGLKLAKVDFTTTGTAGVANLLLGVDNLTNSAAKAVPFTVTSLAMISVTVAGTPTPVIDPATPTPVETVSPADAKVYLAPSAQTVSHPAFVPVEINIDSADNAVAAYGFIVSFDDSILSADVKDVVKGRDGFMAAAALEENRLSITGFDISGVAAAQGINMIIMHFSTNGVAGTANINLLVDNLTNPSAKAITVGETTDATITVAVSQTPVPVETATPEPQQTQDPEPLNQPGSVWLEPSSYSAVSGEQFALQIYANSGNVPLAAYGIFLKFDPSLIQLNTNVGSSSVNIGPDGFISAANPNNEAGELKVTGFDVNGKGPGENLHLLTINLIAQSAGITNIDLILDSLTDNSARIIGTPTGVGASVTIQ